MVKYYCDCRLNLRRYLSSWRASSGRGQGGCERRKAGPVVVSADPSLPISTLILTLVLAVLPSTLKVALKLSLLEGSITPLKMLRLIGPAATLEVLLLAPTPKSRVRA